MTNPANHRNHGVWSLLGRLAMVFGIVALTLVIAGFVLGRSLIHSLEPDATLGELRIEFLDCLGVPCNTDVQVAAPSWLVTLVRLGSGWIDLEPEARSAIDAIRSGQVGVYELAERPDPQSLPTLLSLADERLKPKGWDRVVTVLEEAQLVLLYIPTEEKASTKEIEAFLIVLDEHNLVAVCVQGYTKPLMELASSAIGRMDLSAPRFAIAQGGF